MFNQEEFRKHFGWGISVLTAYLQYNNKVNLTDIDIISESFACDLLNIFYNLNLKIAQSHYSPGYDLIDVKNRVIVQVTADCTPNKVNHTLRLIEKGIVRAAQDKSELESKLQLVGSLPLSYEEKAEKRRQLTNELNNIIDISGYRVIIFFLAQNIGSILNYKKTSSNPFNCNPDLYSFETENDIICFQNLFDQLHRLSFKDDSSILSQLETYMHQNSSLFFSREAIEYPYNCTDKIVEEYANNFEEPLFWHRYCSGTRVTLKNLFVEPDFNILDKRATRPSNIVELLDSFIWGKNRDRILFIDGDAAIGKTSLISWLCYHYRKLDDIGKSIFLDIPLVCIRLRDIDISHAVSAEKCIFEYLSIKSLDLFEKKYQNALIVLDGADELSMLSGISIEEFIHEVRHIFRNNKIIVTSRPKFINMDSFIESSHTFSCQHISLCHFSSNKRAIWLKNFEDPQKCGASISCSVKQYLEEMTDEEAAGVADTPLALYLLAACDITTPMKKNKWALFHEIFHKAIRNTPYNESFHNQGSIYHVALRDEAFAETIYSTIGNIAYKMYQNIKEERYFITATELDEIIFNQICTDSSQQGAIIRKCCVLCSYWNENSSTGALEFYHNDIRDFFMCEYIYDRFFKTKYSLDSDERINQMVELACELFQYGLFAKTTWAQSFSFLFDRIRYEREKNNADWYPIKISDMKRFFSTAIHAAASQSTLWKYSFFPPHYESAKTAFCNFILFLKIWATSVLNEPLDTFSSESQYDLLQATDLFYDWIGIFGDSITVSGNKHISFGSQTLFSNKDFNALNLAKSCFEESIMKEVRFEDTNLSSSLFSETKLHNVVFSNSDLSNINFSGAELESVDFSTANLINACFKDAKLIDVKWPNNCTKIEHTSFCGAQIINTELKRWNLKNVQFKNTLFSNCHFNNVSFSVNLDGCIFENCVFSGSTFVSPINVIFSNSTFSESHFNISTESCTFKDCIIEKNYWTSAVLSRSLFQNTTIDTADFRGAELQTVSFEKSKVKGNVDVFRAKMPRQNIEYLKNQPASLINSASVVIIK